MKFDFKAVVQKLVAEAGEYTPDVDLTPGKFVGVLAYTRVKTSVAGNEYISFKFVADSGPQAGASAWGTQVWSKADDAKSFDRLVKFALTCGVDMEKLAAEVPAATEKEQVLMGEVATRVRGARVSVTVEDEDGSDGVARSKVKWVNRLPNNAPEATKKVTVHVPKDDEKPVAAAVNPLAAGVQASPVSTRPAI